RRTAAALRPLLVTSGLDLWHRYPRISVTRSSRLSAIGPAILLTATSVGAGDILTGSLAGAQVGMAALWAVPAGVILKWTLTEGIARWQMATGTTLLEGWVTRLGRWIQWVFFPYLILF